MEKLRDLHFKVQGDPSYSPEFAFLDVHLFRFPSQVKFLRSMKNQLRLETDILQHFR